MQLRHATMLRSLVVLGGLAAGVLGDLKIEVMKEGLTDLKTTTLTSPNVTNFAGSAEEPYVGGTAGELVVFTPLDGCGPLQSSKYTMRDADGRLRLSAVSGTSDRVIVLMARGGCQFNEKFEHAKAVKGVVGVLVYNGEGDPMPLDDIILTNRQKDLPGYLVSNSLGLELLRKVIKYRGPSGTAADAVAGDTGGVQAASTSASTTPYIQITMTPLMPDVADKANQAIQLALISIIVILALAFGASIVIHMRTSQYSQPASDTSRRSGSEGQPLPPIDVEFLQKLPLKTYSGRRGSGTQSGTGGGAGADNGRASSPDRQLGLKMGRSTSGIVSPTAHSVDEKGLSMGDTQAAGVVSPRHPSEHFEMSERHWPMNDGCPICLDEFNQGEVLNELPCGHCYHIACIQPWLQYRSPYCPLCKLDVREEYKTASRMNHSLNADKDVESHLHQAVTSRTKLRQIWDKLILKTNRSTTQLPSGTIQASTVV